MQRTRKRTRHVVLVAAAFGLLAASCGRSSSKSGGGTTTTTAGSTSSSAAASSTTAASSSSSAAATSSSAAATSSSAAAGGGAPKTGPGFDGTTISLGVLSPFSGPASGPFGIPITNGNRVFFEALNAKGGIAGKYKVKLVEADNKYDPAETVKQYTATKDQVVGYAQVLGTAPIQALLQTLNEDKIVVQPATLDSLWQKEPYLMPIDAPYQIQAINGISYYVEKNGKDKKFCTMTVDSAYGKAGLDGAHYAATQLGLTWASEQTHKANDQDFTAQINALKTAKCDMVWITALPVEFGGIISRAAQSAFTPQWIGQSPTWLGAYVAAPIAPYLKEHFWWMSEGPTWGDTSVPGMVQLLADIKASTTDSGQKPDPYFVFGYQEGKVWAAVLEQAVKDGDLSRAGIVKAMDEVGVVKMDGLTNDQTIGSPAKRQASRANTIFKVTPDTLSSNGGLTAVVSGYSSDAAKSFTF